MTYCMACGISDCASRCDSCKKLLLDASPFLCQPTMAEMGGLQLSTELLLSPPPSPPPPFLCQPTMAEMGGLQLSTGLSPSPPPSPPSPFLCQPTMAEVGGLQLSTGLSPSPPPSPPSPFLCQPTMAEMGGFQLSTELLLSPPPSPPPPFLCQPTMAEMGGLQLSPSPPPSPPSFQPPSLLRSWLDSEGLADATRSQTGLRSAGIIRKLTVAFAIAKLIRHLKDSVASYSQDELLHLCRVDNFSVQMSPDRTSEPGWEVLMEANMITPPMTLQVIKKPQGGGNFSTFASEKQIWGGDNIIDAIVSRHSSFCFAKEVASQDDTKNDSTICYALGVLLDCIFSGGSTMRTTVSSPENPQDTMDDFLRSLSVSPSQFASNDNKYESETRPTKCNRKIMHHEEEISMYLESSQVSRVVRDLLDCGQDRIHSDSTYLSLDTAIVDLHLLLLNPSRLVFEESHQLSPITTMHGRSSETSSLSPSCFKWHK
eukprot:scaffold3848_cov64-Cyclotella_meneghiniana.AAC.1